MLRLLEAKGGPLGGAGDLNGVRRWPKRSGDVGAVLRFLQEVEWELEASTAAE